MQTHCHHKAVLDSAAQDKMFAAMGLELQHNPVSMTIADEALLPAVRSAGSNTLVIADGFSCREQIRHGAGRNALHPVEVLDLALRRAQITSARAVEERRQQPAATVQPAGAIAALAAAAVAGGVALWLGTRRQSDREEPLTPALSPQAARGSKPEPLARRLRGEGGARAAGG
jgi:hypothetical protein